MAEKNNRSPKNSSLLTSLLKAIAEALGTVNLLFQEAKKTLQSQADGFIRRAEYILVVYLWISIGAVFLILGAFFLMMDLGHVSRGAVFSIGGLLTLLISVILLQAAKIKRK